MLIRSRTRYFQSTRRRWWTGRRTIMDGFANTGSVHCYYGGNILLDRRMGLWHLTIFSIHNVSHYWIWWCRSPKRGSKFCSLFTVWTLSSNCAKLVFLLRWIFLKMKRVRFKIKLGTVLLISTRFFLCDSSLSIELMNYLGKNSFYCFFCD